MNEAEIKLEKLDELTSKMSTYLYTLNLALCNCAFNPDLDLISEFVNDIYKQQKEIRKVLTEQAKPSEKIAS